MAAKYGFTEAEYNEAVLKGKYGIAELVEEILAQRRQGYNCKDLQDRLFKLDTALRCLENFSYEYYTEEDVTINSLTVDEAYRTMEWITKYSGIAPQYLSGFDLIL